MKRIMLAAALAVVGATLAFADVNARIVLDLSHQSTLPGSDAVEHGLVPGLEAEYFATLNRYTDLGFGLDVAIPGFDATGLATPFMLARFPYHSGEISVTPFGRLGYSFDLSPDTAATTGPYFSAGIDLEFEGLFFFGLAYQGHAFPIPDATPAGVDYRSRLSFSVGLPLL